MFNLAAHIRELVSKAPSRSDNDSEMSADELIEDFALGLIRVADDNLRIKKEAYGDNYQGDEIEWDILHQSCIELFYAIGVKKGAIDAAEGWADHERWCVRVLAQGVKHLLEHGSFNFGPITGVVSPFAVIDLAAGKENEDFDSFMDFADSVR